MVCMCFHIFSYCDFMKIQSFCCCCCSRFYVFIVQCKCILGRSRSTYVCVCVCLPGNGSFTMSSEYLIYSTSIIFHIIDRLFMLNLMCCCLSCLQFVFMIFKYCHSMNTLIVCRFIVSMCVYVCGIRVNYTILYCSMF